MYYDVRNKQKYERGKNIMNCQNCGRPLNQGEICACAQQQQQPIAPSSNAKTYKILSYIGILWIAGLVANPEKNDPDVKFHVGQGIVLSITMAIWQVISTIITTVLGSIFVPTVTYWGITPSPIVSLATLLLGLVTAAIGIGFMIIGILNANKGENKPLPIIGSFAFYK